MNKLHAGSCLCGRVRFTVEATFERFYLCHCSHCRKDTGSAHAANLFSSSGRLTWADGQSAITTYNLPGTRHTRSFCSICGSALPYAIDQKVVVPAGSLDTDLAIDPDGHIFSASRASWDQDLGSAPAYDAFPA